MFLDRSDAGRRLAHQLMDYKNNLHACVIALPRGGVVTGFEVAKELNVPLDIVVPRKIGAPGHQELAVGAITQDGEPIFNELLMQQLGLTAADLAGEITREQQEAQRRLLLYRAGKKPLTLSGKIVILVDDGIATGATMRAALATVKHMAPQKIIVAVPVCPPDVLQELEQQVDEVVCLEVPSYLGGVGAFFKDFGQIEDREVVELMNRARSF